MLKKLFDWLKDNLGLTDISALISRTLAGFEESLATHETASKWRSLQVKTAIENRANEICLQLRDMQAAIDKAIRSQSTEIDLVREELARHRELMQSFATFQEHEAATYAVQKLERDEQFREQVPAEAHVEDAVRYAGYYFNEHGWTPPEPSRIKNVVLARMGMSKELNGTTQS